eukprot:1853531-Pyramimonas_sp.AAC.2
MAVALGPRGGELLVGPHGRDAPVGHVHHLVALREVLHAVRHQHAGRAMHHPEDGALEDVAPHVRVHRAQHVVQQVDVRAAAR